jgi:DNA anti-recombination protein RmuC
MGKIKSDMEKLVNEVRSSVTARHRGVSDLREGARELLSQDKRERQDRARALTEQLERQTTSRLEATAEMKGTLGRVGEKRKAGVRNGRSEMRHHLRHLHLGRGEMAKELKESVLGEVADIREAVGTLRSAVRTMMGNIAGDVREARRLWRSGPSQMPERR